MSPCRFVSLRLTKRNSRGELTPPSEVKLSQRILPHLTKRGDDTCKDRTMFCPYRINLDKSQQENNHHYPGKNQKDIVLDKTGLQAPENLAQRPHRQGNQIN